MRFLNNFMSLDIETLPSISYAIKLFNQIRQVKLESLKFVTEPET